MKTCWKVNPPGSLGNGTEYYYNTKEGAVKAAIPDIDGFIEEFAGIDTDTCISMALWIGLITPTEIPVSFFFSEENGEAIFDEADLVMVE
jgi:hypothetical protein